MKPLDQRWHSSGLPLRGMPRMGLKWRACLRTMAPAANWKLRDACRESGIKHKRTRPCRLQANGKAERFIRTALKERAYAQACTRSRQGTGYLPISGHAAMPMRGRSRLLAEILQLHPRAPGEQRIDVLYLGLIRSSKMKRRRRLRKWGWQYPTSAVWH